MNFGRQPLWNPYFADKNTGVMGIPSRDILDIQPPHETNVFWMFFFTRAQLDGLRTERYLKCREAAFISAQRETTRVHF